MGKVCTSPSESKLIFSQDYERCSEAKRVRRRITDLVRLIKEISTFTYEKFFSKESSSRRPETLYINIFMSNADPK